MGAIPKNTWREWLERHGPEIRTTFVIASALGAVLLGVLSFRLSGQNLAVGFAAGVGYALAAATGLEAHYDVQDAKQSGKSVKPALNIKKWRARIGIYGSLATLALATYKLFVMP